MFDSKIKKLLAEAKTIAIVGAKDVAGQPVDRVGRYLVDAGYTVYPVHPKRKDVWGLPTYGNLMDVPHPVDIVDVFRSPQHCGEHAREALRLDPLPALFWMQSGITSAEAAGLLAETPVAVMQDRCLMVEHRRLLGSRA